MGGGRETVLTSSTYVPFMWRLITNIHMAKLKMSSYYHD